MQAPAAAATPAGNNGGVGDEAAEDLRETLDQLDSELATMFKPASDGAGPAAPSDGPPKDDDDDPENLLVELVEG